MMFAHSIENVPEDGWQPLLEHLLNVAEAASGFAEPFGGDDFAYAAGLLHDLGKASTDFQRRLHGENVSVDHSTSGAFEAIRKYGKDFGMLLAYCIAGHHGGIPNGDTRSFQNANEYPASRRPLKQRLDDAGVRELELEAQADWLLNELRANGNEFPSLALESFPSAFANTRDRKFAALSIHVFVESVFSCLVDADYLDTERFMDEEASRLRSKIACDSLPELLKKYEKKISEFDAPRSDMDVARSLVSLDAQEAASQPVDLYTMTVGTGGGKTLASMGFALKHAIANGLDRVIVASPFMTITDQTASVLREVFGEANVLEHQSSYDFDSADDSLNESLKLACENWDAPIVVTTNVQLFESLFSNKPGKSRKVHNIVNSVVILDEAQMIPDHVLKPTLAMIEAFSHDCHTTFLLCSATQPPLAGEWPFGSDPREIVGEHEVFERAFSSRAQYLNRGKMELCELVDELAQLDRALCVVDTKRKARLVYQQLRDLTDRQGVFHLSAAMCPAHRMAVLDEVRRRLDAEEPCLVVSTQLIEAGVDISFPEVYRELAGMDSIVQSAGRCNRSGQGSKGVVHVFELYENGERLKSSGWLEDMKRISRNVIDANGGAIDESLVARYFVERYRYADKDNRGVFDTLCNLRGRDLFALRPEQASLDYSIIDSNSKAVLIPYGEKGRELAARIRAAHAPGSFARKAQRFSVSLAPYELKPLMEAGAIEEIPPFLVLRSGDGCEELYSNELGVLRPGEGVLPSVIL